MKTSFSFIDAANHSVKCEVSNENGFYSICGEYENGCGQIFYHIKPANEAQEELVTFWECSHLKGTNKVLDDILRDVVAKVQYMEEERAAEAAEASDYDISQDDDEMLSAIMDEKCCDRHDAVCMVALMRELGMEFSELEDVTGSGSEYSAQGVYYLVDDSDTLDSMARDRMKEDEDCYLECWIDAVRNRGERRGFDDWCDYIVDMDGWCSVLNSWDGRYNEEQVFGEWICVSRS